MKSIKKLLLTMLILALTAMPAMANGITLKVNDEILKPTVSPVIENGTTLVPLRIISENLGATVQWDPETRMVVIITQKQQIGMMIDNPYIYYLQGDKLKEIPVAPKIINGSTMVPLRVVSEALNCTVNWDNTTQTASVTGTVEPLTDASEIEIPPSLLQPEQSKPVGETATEENPTEQVTTATSTSGHPIKDGSYIVYTTKTGTKYHEAGCSSLKKSSYAKTLEEVTGKFDPCENCNAPVLG